MNEVSLIQILDARERRVAKQKQLLDKYGKTLICFTMNIPGPIKVTPHIQGAFYIGNALLTQAYTYLHVEDTSSPAGLERFYVVDADPLSVKRYCAILENTQKYGRLFDMDVIAADGRKISRQELGQDARRCLICNKDAAVCGRSRAHTVQQLQQAVHDLCADSIQKLVSDAAVKALSQEVLTTPKPGLVDAHNNGSHKDMDLSAFQKSCQALTPYWSRFAGCHRDDPRQLFEALRSIGIEAEKAMLAATDGINTHKGAIFSMGIACAAAARSFPDTAPETILSCCAEMTQGLVARDFGRITEPKTAGERLYAAYGITGIRGQAEQGFPAVLKVGYPVLQEGLRRGLSLNDAGCAVLLHLLAATDDTNMISRSDLQTLRKIQAELHALLASDPYPKAETIHGLDQAFIRQNLSPGGSADLLALTYFLHFLHNETGGY